MQVASTRSFVWRTSRRELRPGLWLALAFASGLTAARFIDVAEDGKAMLLFGTSFFAAAALASIARPRWYLPLAVAYLPFSKVYPLPLAGVSGANMTNFVIALGFLALATSRAQGRPPLPVALRRRPGGVLRGDGFARPPPRLLGRPRPPGPRDDVPDRLAPMLFYLLARGLVRNREDVRGLLWLMAWLSPYLFGKEGMGGGDIKLLAMVGAFLGWEPVLLTVLVGSSIGALTGLALIALKRLRRDQYLPFGAFLALGAVVAMFFFHELQTWYVGFLAP